MALDGKQFPLDNVTYISPAYFFEVKKSKNILAIIMSFNSMNRWTSKNIIFRKAVALLQ